MQGTTWVVNSQAAYDGSVAAGVKVRMAGARIPDEELEQMSFAALRDRMLLEFIPTEGARTKEQLLAVYERDWNADKNRLLLYVFSCSRALHFV
jgi:hypothetical protein